ncbi:hypothetical protein bsdcttw_19280 [Anaerocolumna chitinilytica]|uniref:Uncharacterized protein n=1 Tax=Anaerocolumna chitinilytica TaxID=1727145 RepID=A0A7I8DME0_9FIRM|nr:hypothetical protein bsdcttw_19280 [Anaerocolumna chitinilytica]
MHINVQQNLIYVNMYCYLFNFYVFCCTIQALRSGKSAKNNLSLFGRLILLRKTKQIYFKGDVSEGPANSIGYSNDANDNLTTIIATAGTASVHYS